uniref:Zn(2)-C6 fungal-type domain-containing protein n=1 Tax=Moniliophthora roreri TaxID=221103 RepID=A0A0W0FW73_MONRR
MSGYRPYKAADLHRSSGQSSSAGSGNASTKSGHSSSSKANKRMRGEIACAECRRLKIRCDRIVPCTTCVKRGCAALCPNGTIPPGQSSRFVLAATEHLELELAKLEARRHALEDALAIEQAAVSDQPHPLLELEFQDEDKKDLDELPGERTQSNTPEIKTEDASEEPASNPSDALGTLYIARGGVARFFGPSGGSESLLLGTNQESSPSISKFDRLPELDASYLPDEIIRCCDCFPLTANLPTSSIQASIESFLPPIERAVGLCNTFLEHLSWMFHIVSRQEIVGRIIPSVYKQNGLPYGPHQLALMLVVLGIGALVDLNLEPYNLEAQHYYRLARAAMALQSVLTQPSIVTVKALHLMSIYNGMSGKESNLEQSYALLNLAGQVATRIGIHVDPLMWKFEGRELYERRVYFWNLLSATLWQSLVTGRPPAILSNYIDCKIPTAEEENTYQQGEVPLGFGIWGFRASIECLLPVVRATLGTQPPDYEKVLELDKKIRQFATPPLTFDSHPSDDRTAHSMRNFVRSHYQDLMLLYLHRSFFLQAMTDYPANPLLSPYSKSVTTGYQSACCVLEDTRTQFMKKPLLTSRVWRIWSFAFAAAVVVGTVAMRGLHLNLNPPAIEQMQMTCRLFRKAATTNSRAAKALPVLETILRKALEAQRSNFDITQNQIILDNTGSPAGSTGTSESSSTSADKDEISIIVGRPTVIYSDERSKPSDDASASSIQGSFTHHPPLRSSQTLPADSILSQPLTRAYDQHPSMDLVHESAVPVIKITTPAITGSRAHGQHSTGPQTQSTFSHFTQSDLSEGWESLFHETSRPIYQHRLNQQDFLSGQPRNPGHNRASLYEDWLNQGGQGTQSHTQVAQDYGFENGGVSHHPFALDRGSNNGASFTDRWTSFMNYDFMGSL